MGFSFGPGASSDPPSRRAASDAVRSGRRSGGPVLTPGRGPGARVCSATLRWRGRGGFVDEPEEYGVLEVDTTRRRQLRAIVEYVQGIHHHIDPDRFLIDEEWLRSIFDRLDEQPLETTRMRVTYRDLLLVETLVDAAGTYASRRDFPELDGVDDDDLDELNEWLGREATALFRKPPTVH